MATTNQNQKTNKTVVPESAVMMENCAMWEENGALHIVVPDLSKHLRKSSTGASWIVASSTGNVPAPGRPSVKVGVNLFEKIAE
jgi:hypothetical protein